MLFILQSAPPFHVGIEIPRAVKTGSASQNEIIISDVDSKWKYFTTGLQFKILDKIDVGINRVRINCFKTVDKITISHILNRSVFYEMHQNKRHGKSCTLTAATVKRI